MRTLSGLHLLGVNARAFQVHPEVLEEDRAYREASLRAEARYEHMPEDELEQLFRNFLIVSGGSPRKSGIKKKGSGFDAIRKEHASAYQRWTAEEDTKLAKLYHKGVQMKELTETFGRKRGAIVSRIKKLGLAKENH